MKTLNMYAKVDRKGYKPMRRVQDLIPVKDVYEDGIFQLTQTQFSQTWCCTDLNYEMASDDEREFYNEKYQELLNSFESSCHVKVMVVNSQMSQSQIESDILMPLKDDENDIYRKEFNELFLSETKRKSGIVQQRYITITIERKSLEQAQRAFQRIGVALKSKLTEIGSICEVLNGMERCKLLHDFYRENEQDNFHFDLAEIKAARTNFKDYLCPDSAYHAPDYLQLGNQYVRVEFIKGYPKQMFDAFLYELLELPRKMFVTVDMIPLAKDDGVAIASNKLDGVEADIARHGQRQIRNDIINVNVPQHLEAMERDARADLEALQGNGQRLFLQCIYIVHAATSKEQLDADTESLRTTAAENSAQLGTLKFQQMDALKSALPIGCHLVDVMRTMKTEALALFMPFRAQDVQDKGGIWYGRNAISDNIIMVDRVKLKNQGGFITGVPGAGKSVLLKEMIAQIILTTEDDVIICDPESEYGQLTQALGGEVIRISGNSPHHINPLDMVDGYGDENSSDPLQDKVSFVSALFEELTRGHTEDVSWAKAQSILDRAVKGIYEAYQRGGKMPTLTILRDKLMDMEEPEASDLALYLERFTTGTQGVFAHETNVNTQNRIVDYDILGLGEQLKTLGLLVMTDAILNRVTVNCKRGKRTHIIIDEFHVMFQNEMSAKFFDSAWRRWRERNGSPTAATQNVDTLLGNKESRAMLSNSEFLVMLSQSDTDRKRLGELLELPENQLNYVRNVKAGHGLIKYDHYIIPFENEFPKDTELYKLITTKPAEGFNNHG